MSSLSRPLGHWELVRTPSSLKLAGYLVCALCFVLVLVLVLPLVFPRSGRSDPRRDNYCQNFLVDFRPPFGCLFSGGHNVFIPSDRDSDKISGRINTGLFASGDESGDSGRIVLGTVAMLIVTRGTGTERGTIDRSQSNRYQPSRNTTSGYSPIAHWFIRDLESRKIEIPAEDFPASPYNQSEADPDDVEKGLFHGPLFFKAFNAMFFGKSSVYTGKYRKNSVASRNGLCRIAGCHIAYAAVQAHFALGTCERWNDKATDLNYRDLYDELVDFFEGTPDDEVILDLLKYWNDKQKLGDKSSSNNDNNSKDDKGKDNELTVAAKLQAAEREAGAASTSTSSSGTSTKRSTTNVAAGASTSGTSQPTGSKTQRSTTTVSFSGTSQSMGSNTKRSTPTASSPIQSEDSNTRRAASAY
ncbi:hypothetical protein D9757_013637 [Collybiopsis confluens]|uniref:Uncharacterized protein n=1 Tax=Collybiopsis confluens TaxID=2823264 RepID=A0A8H5G825_9AGAR|nr:hypothetical protein D9757_013637 [Collybiopsis confluens]